MPNTKKTDDKPPAAPGPAPTQEPITGPGPTTFAGVDPAKPPVPEAEAASKENTTQEDVGTLPDRPVTLDRILRHWDGGERIIATRLAQQATKKLQDQAAEQRPELRTYLAGDVA
jgi:hypothetical protein